jgi:hypothetical protein
LAKRIRARLSIATFNVADDTKDRGRGHYIRHSSLSADVRWTSSAREHTIRVEDWENDATVATFAGDAIVGCCVFADARTTIVAVEDAGRIGFAHSSSINQPLWKPLSLTIRGYTRRRQSPKRAQLS